MLAGHPSKSLPSLVLTILIGLSIGIGARQALAAAGDHIRISEFCASNIDTIADESGDFPDWIELENATNKPIDIRQYVLTDDPLIPDKYRLPSYRLNPGSRIIVFASGKSVERSQPPFHAPFKLSRKGEYLALIERSSQEAITEFSPRYPTQPPGSSFGIPGPTDPETTAPREPIFKPLIAPTPGQPNAAAGRKSPLPPPTFRPKRGLYQAPLKVTLEAGSEEAVIRYTTDGTEPSSQAGTIYSGPIEINQTQIVRAVAIVGEKTSPTITHSYLFPSDVIQQTSPPGFPKRWGQIPADYAMDPRITGDSRYKDSMIPALQSLPTVSLSTSLPHLFSGDAGIYANPNKQGVEWERPVSMEWIGHNSETFHINAGVRIQGGWFRGPTVTRKHSFRLLFKRQYGDARLEYDIFNEFGATGQFESLILRAGANDGYSWNEAEDSVQFIRDEFGRRVVMAMGQLAPRGRFVHLYLNGCYWGLYNLCERPNEDFSSSYIGGSAEEWDAINTGTAKSGSLVAWTNLKRTISRISESSGYFAIQGKNPSGIREENRAEALNIAHYVDYLLANIWMGNADWPDKNYWIGLHQGSPPLGTRFYPWDLEVTMGNNRARSPLTYRAPHEDTLRSGATEPHFWLRNLPEYQIDFSDRVQKHLVNHGVLSPQSMARRYRHWADKIELAVIAESARWGDDQGGSPKTPADWQKERDWILGTYIPQRGPIVLEQLRRSGLYSRVGAPRVLPSDGVLAEGESLLVASPEKELYYTLDGTDPRLPGGAIHPDALPLEAGRTTKVSPHYTLIGEKSVWRYVSKTLSSPTGWGPDDLPPDTPWKVALAPLGVGAKGIQSTMKVEPAKGKKPRYQPFILRKTFALRHPLPITQLNLNIDSTDAVAILLNGQLLYRAPELQNSTPQSPFSTAKKELSDPLELTVPAFGLLQPGKNEVLVYVHPRNQKDKSTRFDLSIIGETSSRESELTLANITPPQHGTLKIRAKRDDRWSALTEVDFTVSIPEPQQGSLHITEISFNPKDASGVTERSITRDAQDFEYLKITNASTMPINLTGTRVRVGVEFEFPRLTILKPGTSLYLSRNPQAFRARFGNDLTVMGPFRGRLNNGGERLEIVSREGSIIEAFNYDSNADWPIQAADPGGILSRVDEYQSTNPSEPTGWYRKEELVP